MTCPTAKQAMEGWRADRNKQPDVKIRHTVTSFLSNGWSQFLPGFNSGEVSAQGFLDTSAQWTVGSTYSLNMAVGDNYYVTFNGVLLDLTVSSAVDRAGEVDVSFGTNGQFNTTFSL